MSDALEPRLHQSTVYSPILVRRSRPYDELDVAIENLEQGTCRAAG